MQTLVERYLDEIKGVISCYDRLIITGTLPQICFAEGMTTWLYAHNIRIFDYAKFAEGLKQKIRENAERLASENGIEIEFLKKQTERKEDRVKKVLERRGSHAGLVHIISVMETCNSYKPWHDKITHKTYLKPDTSKCLHYYFYFIDETIGLCYMRVPTWCPFRLQFYFNGHNWLSSELTAQGIQFIAIDNCYIDIEDFAAAQKISDRFSIKILHQILDQYGRLFCPVQDALEASYHWSIMQAEYSTDIIFKTQKVLQEIYEDLVKTAIHTVKPDHIATFLGRKLVGQYQGEMGNRYNVRLEGTCIRHQMGSVSIKMYDKFRQVLRIETTVNKVKFFQHYRTVEHRDGSQDKKMTSMKKNIYSLAPLVKCLKASNRRYLEFISAFETDERGRHDLNRTSHSVKENGRNYSGINFFDSKDLKFLLAISRGEFCIRGFQNKNLKKYLIDMTCSQISRLLKRLRVLGIIRKASHCYRYYLTHLGKRVIAAGLKLKEMFLIPELTAANC